MSLEEELFKILDDYKDLYDLNDVINEINNVFQKIEISNQEFINKIEEYRKKYPLEMRVLDLRDQMINEMNIQRITISNRNMLINMLISISGVKILEKIGKSYKPTDIKDYQYIIDVIKEDRKI